MTQNGAPCVYCDGSGFFKSSRALGACPLGCPDPEEVKPSEARDTLQLFVQQLIKATAAEIRSVAWGEMIEIFRAVYAERDTAIAAARENNEAILDARAALEDYFVSIGLPRHPVSFKSHELKALHECLFQKLPEPSN